MGRRDDEQRARRAALEGQSAWRAERAAKDARCSRLGVEVALALRERDGWVAVCEERAGAALTALTGVEGLSVGEALRWCGGSLTAAQAARLRRLARSAETKGDGGRGGAVSEALPPPSAGD